MLTRRPFHLDATEALSAFARAHPGGDFDARLIRTLLCKIPASPEHVLDVWAGERRVLVASLLDTLTNATNTAQLVVLGLDAMALSPAITTWLLDWAEAMTGQGPRQTIEVPLPHQLAGLREALLDRGYHHGYSNYDMATGAIAQLPPAPEPLAEPWHWQDFSEPYMRPYYDLLIAAFAEIPGAQIASWDHFPALARQAPIQPRLLLHGERLAGFAKVVLRGEDQADGYIGTIARHPAFRGARLGPALLHEALQMLHGRGAKRYSLCVAASNARALALYQQHGFAVVSEEPTYLKSLG